jgi:hypothetical protein
VLIEKGHKDECTRYGPYLEAYISIISQDQAFEEGFSNEN